MLVYMCVCGYVAGGMGRIISMSCCLGGFDVTRRHVMPDSHSAFVRRFKVQAKVVFVVTSDSQALTVILVTSIFVQLLGHLLIYNIYVCTYHIYTERIYNVHRLYTITRKEN